MRQAFVESGTPDAGPVEVFVARGRAVLLLLGACAFVAGGVFLLLKGDPVARWAGIAAIVFFGGCALVALWQLFDRRPRLVIDDAGVFDRTLGVGRIPWDAIVDADWASINGHHFIGLTLRDEAQWLAKLSPLQRRLARANRGLGLGALNLNLAGLAVAPAAVYALVQAEIAARAPDASGGEPEGEGGNFGAHAADMDDDGTDYSGMHDSRMDTAGATPSAERTDASDEDPPHRDLQ